VTAYTSNLSGGLSFTGRFLPLNPYRHAVAYIYANFGIAQPMYMSPDAALYVMENVGLDRSAMLRPDGTAYEYENVVQQVGDGLPTLAGAQDAIRSRFQRVPRE